MENETFKLGEFVGKTFREARIRLEANGYIFQEVVTVSDFNSDEVRPDSILLSIKDDTVRAAIEVPNPDEINQDEFNDGDRIFIFPKSSF